MNGYLGQFKQPSAIRLSLCEAAGTAEKGSCGNLTTDKRLHAVR